jgi:hypothetical protein
LEDKDSATFPLHLSLLKQEYFLKTMTLAESNQ